jgi:hypothetical protein
MAVLMLPGMVACMGAVVVASENSNPEAILTLTLQTEGGEECLLRISEKAAKQIAKVITEFNRSRDFLFAEEQSAASATLQSVRHVRRGLPLQSRPHQRLGRSPSGSNLTFESRPGFPAGSLRASLADANGNLHHSQAR